MVVVALLSVDLVSVVLVVNCTTYLISTHHIKGLDAPNTCEPSMLCYKAHLEKVVMKAGSN